MSAVFPERPKAISEDTPMVEKEKCRAAWVDSAHLDGWIIFGLVFMRR